MSAASDTPLPIGTVTFLFTDIEGSTRLLTALGSEYEEVLAAHARILRKAIAAHGGVEVGTEGDAFFAAFPSAIEAVRAAVGAQRDIVHHAWPDAGEVRVRMGVHTGEGRLGGDNYVGLDVHRAARIASAGHGGQVLLSDATRGLVAHELPEGVGLRDLAEHRLKDLPRPERIWQIEVDGLASDFPALLSLDARPNNLPPPTTPLIGRKRELVEVATLLQKDRLVTLIGPGGTGKTRLALAVVHQVLTDFADGAFFIGLEDAHDRAIVAAMAAAALGVREKVDRDLEAGVKAFTADREVLLVLDNFEQVRSAAPLVAELLAGSPRLRILVTSRAPLHLSAEREYAVNPLDLPDLERLPSVASLSQYGAVALFIDRATAVRAGFAVTNANASAIAEICSRLDGLPLAIELAAARVKLLAPEAILDRLVRRLPVLAQGPTDLPARQRTLRGTMEWSYELLTEPERAFFRRLGVFAGGWGIEACEAVCNPLDELGIDTLAGLTSLSDNSLIHRADSDADGGDPRFAMLQVVREFATDQLEADDHATAVRRRHAQAVLDLAERAEPELTGRDLPLWQRRMRREEDNVRAALRWAVDNGEAMVGLRISAALWRFWQYWAEFREGRRWLETLLQVPSAAEPSEARARALRALGSIAYWQGDADLASSLYEEALSIYRDIGDERGIADALFDSAWAAIGRGDIVDATSRARDARELYERADDRGGTTRVESFLVTGAYLMGGGGSKDEAIAAIRRALAVAREQGRLFDEADLLGSIGFVQFRAGEYEDALAGFRESVRLWRAARNVGMAPYLKMGAALELRLGRHDRAARLAAAAARAVDEMGGELPSAMIGDINPLDEVANLLSPDDFAQAVEDGRAMSFDEAMTYALEESEGGREGEPR